MATAVIKPKVIVVVGTTASGKSGLAVEIAKKFNGEVISADSRQVYKKLNIGTAKITEREMQGVPHHLIDIRDVDETYTVVDFKKDAELAIADILARGNTPIITGGTFFYIDTLLNRISTPEVPPNEALRQELGALDAKALYEKLQEADPRRAQEIDKDNKRRLVRALEIAQALGSVPLPQKEESPYQVLMLGIKIPKEELREKFRHRAHAWLEQGFMEEITQLLSEGVSRDRLFEMGFEYQLGVSLLEGVISESEFNEMFVQKNWQYAKRQLTWLKRDLTIQWVYLSEKREIDMIIEQFLIN